MVVDSVHAASCELPQMSEWTGSHWQPSHGSCTSLLGAPALIHLLVFAVVVDVGVVPRVNVLPSISVVGHLGW